MGGRPFWLPTALALGLVLGMPLIPLRAADAPAKVTHRDGTIDNNAPQNTDPASADQTVGDALQTVAGETVEAKTFTHPSGWLFAPFPDSDERLFAYARGLFSGTSVEDAQVSSAGEVRGVWSTSDADDLANIDRWDLGAAGNLRKPGGGGNGRGGNGTGAGGGALGGGGEGGDN